jgi:hypothetical protein
MRQNRLLFLGLILVVAVGLTLALAACDNGGDNAQSDTGDSGGPTPTVESVTGGDDGDGSGPNLGTGLDVSGPDVAGPDASGGLGTTLPGCDDLDAEECPVPLDPSVVGMDAEASAGGVTLAYPSRYFDAATSEDDVLITVTPSERNRFELKGTFEVYFADSIDSALAELDDLEGELDSAVWSTDTLTGTIGVVNETAQEPPLTTAIGAFETADGRVIVLKATTTGTFGWYFHTQLYEAMLDSLVVAAE